MYRGVSNAITGGDNYNHIDGPGTLFGIIHHNDDESLKESSSITSCLLFVSYHLLPWYMCVQEAGALIYRQVVRNGSIVTPSLFTQRCLTRHRLQ